MLTQCCTSISLRCVGWGWVGEVRWQVGADPALTQCCTSISLRCVGKDVCGEVSGGCARVRLAQQPASSWNASPVIHPHYSHTRIQPSSPKGYHMLSAPWVRSAAGPPWKNGKSFATVGQKGETGAEGEGLEPLKGRKHDLKKGGKQWCRGSGSNKVRQRPMWHRQCCSRQAADVPRMQGGWLPGSPPARPGRPSLLLTQDGEDEAA